MNRKIIIAVTGASGAIYARTLLEDMKRMSSLIEECGVIFSSNAEDVWKHELGEITFRFGEKFKRYETNDFLAPFASGSSDYDTMIVIPCSMGTLGRISSGTADNLITRAADVMLKERRNLILVPREAPLNLIHLRNMATITESGGIICPATPSFYSKPDTISDIARTVTDRILYLSGFKKNSYKWGDN